MVKIILTMKKRTGQSESTCHTHQKRVKDSRSALILKRDIMDMPSTKRGAGVSDSRWFTNHQMTQKVTNDVIPIRNHTMILLPPSSGASFESWHYLNHTESVLRGPVQRMSMTGNMCPTSHVA